MSSLQARVLLVEIRNEGEKARWDWRIQQVGRGGGGGENESVLAMLSCDRAIIFSDEVVVVDLGLSVD